MKAIKMLESCRGCGFREGRLITIPVVNKYHQVLCSQCNYSRYVECSTNLCVCNSKYIGRYEIITINSSSDVDFVDDYDRAMKGI